MRPSRALPALLALALALAPSWAQPVQRPAVLTFWSPFTGGDGAFFDSMIAAFNASQADVVMKNATVDFASYYPRLGDALAAGTAPDIVVVHQDRIMDYVASSSFLPLDGPMKSAGLEPQAFEPGPLGDCRFGGKTYAIPMDVHPIVMFYNKALLAKAGIAKPPTSYAELVAAARAVGEKTGAIGVAMDNVTAKYKAYTLARLFLSFVAQQGVPILASDNRRANFDGPAAQKAYQFLSDLVNRSAVTPKGLDYDFSVEYFRRGKAAFHFNGVWVTGLFESEPGLDFGAVQLPAFFGRNAAWSGVHAFAVPVQRRDDPARLALVMRFIDWMTAHGELWAKAGNIPTRKSVFAKDGFKALPHMTEYADAVSNSFVTPRTSKWPACYAAIADSLEESIAANADARSATSRLESRINDILAR